MKRLLSNIQPLGRALMLPIAVLPIAGLLLRLGQPDMLNIGFISAAGQAIFSNLGLLFAIGVASGFARDANGAACLAGVVCYLVTRHGAEALMAIPVDVTAGVPPKLLSLAQGAWKDLAISRIDVPIGIASGLLGGLLYNRFATISLPDYLGFFAGRRFVPIVAGLAGLGLAGLIGPAYGWIDAGIEGISRSILAAGPLGLFVYGVLNRLLLVTGLHHILNNMVWFVVGHYGNASGDLPRFFAGDPSAGGFMTGFFPVMIFGLPAACLAMYHTTPVSRRKETGGMLVSLGLTAMLTGVTEPIEFSFMFLAPALYAMHAILTGGSMALMNVLGVHLGFGFSAGLIDYVLNFGKSTRPLLLLPVGAVYAVIYYTTFRWAIVRFALGTPGRDMQISAVSAAEPPAERAQAFIAALGGAANVTVIDACTTRLRLGIAQQDRVDEARLKALGARGVLRPTAFTLQVVLGPIADQVASEMRRAIQQGTQPNSSALQPTSEKLTTDNVAPDLSPRLVAALGGRNNIQALAWHHGRLRITIADLDAVDRDRLIECGIRHIAVRESGVLHLLFREDRRDQLKAV